MILGECTNAYATVRPYLGWPELHHLVAPYLRAAAAGAGWGAVMLVAMGRHAWVARRQIDRRSGGERRAAPSAAGKPAP